MPGASAKHRGWSDDSRETQIPVVSHFNCADLAVQLFEEGQEIAKIGLEPSVK